MSNSRAGIAAEIDRIVLTITPLGERLAARRALRALQAVVASDVPPTPSYAAAELCRLSGVVARFDQDAAAALSDLAARVNSRPGE